MAMKGRRKETGQRWRGIAVEEKGEGDGWEGGRSERTSCNWDFYSVPELNFIPTTRALSIVSVR